MTLNGLTRQRLLACLDGFGRIIISPLIEIRTAPQLRVLAPFDEGIFIILL